MNIEQNEGYKHDRIKELMDKERLGSIDDPGYQESAKLAHERVRERVEWEEFCNQQGLKLLWTFNFIDPKLRVRTLNPEHKRAVQRSARLINERRAIEIANELIKRVNQKLFKRSKNDHLMGIGCLEYQKCGSVHFHMGIMNDVPVEEFEAAVLFKLEGAESSAKKAVKEKIELDSRFIEVLKSLDSSQRKLLVKERHPMVNEHFWDIFGTVDVNRSPIHRIIETRKNAGIWFPDIRRDRDNQSLRMNALKDDFLMESDRHRKLLNVTDAFKWLDKKNIDVREVYSDGAAKYITKVLEAFKRGDMFPFSAKDGILIGRVVH